MLLVRDTIRLIGEIPVQAGKAGFNFFFSLSVVEGVEGAGGRVWDHLGPLSFFYDFFLSRTSAIFNMETHAPSSPEQGHTG